MAKNKNLISKNVLPEIFVVVNEFSNESFVKSDGWKLTNVFVCPLCLKIVFIFPKVFKIK